MNKNMLISRRDQSIAGIRERLMKIKPTPGMDTQSSLQFMLGSILGQMLLVPESERHIYNLAILGLLEVIISDGVLD